VREVRFSARAESDLQEIAAYTLRRWGVNQCAHYVGELEACCQQLADSPELGRPYDDVRPGLLRHRQGRHVIFYRVRPYGIRIVAVLHGRMLPERHLADDDDDDA
jgi:toxin ParE1/3/4